jgi:hypothetical protein
MPEDPAEAKAAAAAICLRKFRLEESVTMGSIIEINLVIKKDIAENSSAMKPHVPTEDGYCMFASILLLPWV